MHKPNAIPLLILLVVAVAGVMMPALPTAVVTEGINTGDTAWMLCATALVLLMTPGLAFFYGGMVNAKNVISTMLQSFVANDPGAQVAATRVANAQAKFCVMSFTTDWRFSPARSRELVDALMAAKKDVCYLEIDAPQGHDAFLIPIPRYLQAFSNYMNRISL